MRALLGDERLAALRQHCFLKNNSPMARITRCGGTVLLREGQLVRRTCCQRYRLPDVQTVRDHAQTLPLT